VAKGTRETTLTQKVVSNKEEHGEFDRREVKSSHREDGEKEEGRVEKAEADGEERGRRDG
jgi:hypothetical protein